MTEDQVPNPFDSVHLLGHPRDIHICTDEFPDRVFQVRLRGYVTRVHRMGKGLLFLDLRDATGKIQVLADRSEMPGQAWEIIQAVRVGARIFISGRTGRARDGSVSVRPDTVRIVVPRLPEGVESLGEDLDDAVSGPFMLARVSAILRNRLKEMRYDEIEPPLLVPPATGDRVAFFVPLRNQSRTAALLESQGETLMKAVLSGHYRVFCISKVFHDSWNSPDSSPEMTAVLLQELMMQDSEDPIALMESLAKTALSHFRTRPRQRTGGPILFDESWLDPSRHWRSEAYGKEVRIRDEKTLLDPLDAVKVPTVLKIPYTPNRPPKSAYVSERHIFLWPPDLCLGTVETRILDETLKINSIALIIERLVMVVLGVHDIRELYPSWLHVA